ncbi:bacteriocin immunity protein [Lactovum odontotermitis]
MQLKATEQEKLVQINDLIQDPDISEKERKILTRAKNEIDKGGMFESHLIDLRNWLLPLVVSQQISEKALAFYKELRADRKIGMGEGISLVNGMTQDF